MITELQAEIQLVKSILHYNNYYDNIREYLKKKNISIDDFAYDLVIHLDYGIPYHSIYYMLDNIEFVLQEYEEGDYEEQEFNEVQDFFDFLYEYNLWGEDY